MLVDQIITRLCAMLLVLAVVVSGLGMQAANAGTAQAAHSGAVAHADDVHGGHATDAGMAHHQHDAPAAQTNDHKGHSDCAMTVCCHLGGTSVSHAHSPVKASRATFYALSTHQYSDAVKDRADKPPKHA